MDENLQNQQVDPDEQYSFGAQGAKDPELIKWQLSGKDLLEEIRNLMMGNSWNPTTEKWEPDADPLMNQEGINAIIKIVQDYVNKNTILSTLEEPFILYIVREINFDVNELLVASYEDFGIKKQYLSVVSNSICNMIYFAMQRALKGGEKTFLTSTEQRRYDFHTPVPGQGEKKGGIFRFFRR